MGKSKICDQVKKGMLLFEDLPLEHKIHINSCEECGAEFDKIKKMQDLVRISAPSGVSLKDSVMGRIKNENIKIEPYVQPKRRHIPIGTISAAAAVLAVGVIAYRSDLLNKAADFTEDAQIEEEQNSGETVNNEATESIEESGVNLSNFYEAHFVSPESGAEPEVSFDSATPVIPERVKDRINTELSAGDNKVKNPGAAKEETSDDAQNTSDLGEAICQIAIELEADDDISLFYSKIEKIAESGITKEDFDNAGDEMYINFIVTVINGENEYTKEAFDEFCEENK